MALRLCSVISAGTIVILLGITGPANAAEGEAGRKLPADVKQMKPGNTDREEAIDKELGIMDRSWSVNRLRVNSRRNQPPEVRPGPPPYPQQPEGIQEVLPTPG